MPPIDTSKVTDRRSLHFHTPAELLAEAERIAAAEGAGRLRCTGNWTAGQTFGHLATWINMPYDGYPPNLKAPWFVKVPLRLMKKKFFKGPLRAGVRIPKLKDGTLGLEVLPFEEGYSRFIKAWDRLSAAPPTTPNVIFGVLTHQEWITMHLRHAELHLGFLHP